MNAIKDALNWLRAAWSGLVATLVGASMSLPEILNAGAAVFTIFASLGALYFGWQRHKMQKERTRAITKTHADLRHYMDDAALPPRVAASVAVKALKDQKREKDAGNEG